MRLILFLSSGFGLQYPYRFFFFYPIAQTSEDTFSCLLFCKPRLELNAEYNNSGFYLKTGKN